MLATSAPYLLSFLRLQSGTAGTDSARLYPCPPAISSPTAMPAPRPGHACIFPRVRKIRCPTVEGTRLHMKGFFHPYQVQRAPFMDLVGLKVWVGSDT